MYKIFHKSLIFIFISIFNLNNSYAFDTTKNKIILSCIQNADFPIKQNYGSKFENLNVEDSLRKCIKAYKIYPNSIKVIRSLARVYLKDNKLKQALNLLHISADKKDPYAQYYLGVLYFDGKQIKENKTKALEFYKMSANQGFSRSQFNLAKIYENGLIVKKNLKEALKYYELAAKQNLINAHAELGRFYYNGYGVKKDIKKAIQLFTFAANQGHVLGQYNLGYLYQRGDGIKRNVKKAIQFYTLAADQGNVNAQVELGNIYDIGDAVKKNVKKALQFYIKAANQGDVYSQSRLGQIFYLKNDFKNAFRFFKLAADQGNSNSQNNLGLLYFNGQFVKKDLNKAFKFFKLSAYQDNKTGQKSLATCYEFGFGVKKDINEAIRLYKLSAKQGNVSSFVALGQKYSRGVGVPKSYKKAYLNFIKAGDNSHALDGLGTLYRLGEENFKANFKKAIEYYTKSIKLDDKNPFPLFHLAQMYFKGYGFEKRNIPKAIDLYTKSAEKGNPEAAEKLSEIYELGIGVDKNNQKALYWIERIKNIPKYAEENFITINNFNIDELQKSRFSNLSNKIVQVNLSNKGKFYAVMIGVSKYENFTPLKTPLKDIEVVGNVLQTKYGFELINLKNPTQRNITDKLFEIEKKLTKNDSLLIYFAGHGNVKNKNDGYWIPTDGHKEDEGTWISNDYITKKLKSIKSHNILIIADSCYSGTIGYRGGKVEKEEQKSENYYLKTKSRIAITSGANQPVLDGGAGEHSIFARLLINKLNNNKKPMITSQLHGSISNEVREITEKLNVKQTPVRIPLYDAGHVAPDFVFIPK